MQIIHFDPGKDLKRLDAYLRERYLEHRNTISWLPQRLHDMVYRIGTQEAEEGLARSIDFIYMWEEDGDTVACILPDGGNIYVSIRDSFEYLFPSMVSFVEQNCLPLFEKLDDGSAKCWIMVSSRVGYMQKTLADLGYLKADVVEYVNCVYPLNTDPDIELPEGFSLFYDDDYPDEVKKWSALRLGFHTDWESPDYVSGMSIYNSRKNSPMFPDSFECVVADNTAAEWNDVCAYSFVYIDRETMTAFVEPVATREKYRRRGIGTAMMHGVIRKCRELGIDKCYVDAYGWRKDFYNSAGFSTEDIINFWCRTLK